MSEKGSAGLLSCPGEGGSRAATLETITCPSCGAENEIFSDEDQVLCEECKAVVKRG